MKTDTTRIALCISGQPRAFAEAFPYIKKNIIDCNEKVDVFLHCWYDESQTGQRYTNTSDTVHEEGVNVISPDIPEKLRRLYQPIDMLVEAQENFSDHVKPEYLAARDKTNPFATFSMWTSIQRCNALKQKYERENGFVYDVVIKCRYDLKLESSVTIHPDHGELHTAGVRKFETDTYVADILFVSTSLTMDKVALLLESVDQYFHAIGRWGNEFFLGTHLKQYNIKTKYHPEWHFTLIRGKKTWSGRLKQLTGRVRAKLRL